MKKIISLLLIILLIPINNINAKEFDITADYVILYNLNEDEILYELNSETKTSIASLTKIMSAIVAIENIEDINEKVKITSNAFNNINGYALAGFNVGSKVSYLDLIYGILLPSGAEAANMLNLLVKVNDQSLVDLMNEKAKELNLITTHFDNPIGKDSKNNYSCAKDVATILKYALKNETFKEVFTTLTYKTENNVKLNSTLIKYATNYGFDISHILGAKSGFTYDAGYCLASISSINNVDYLLVVIHSDTNKKYNAVKDTLTIYNYFSSNYSYQEIVNENDIIITLPTKYGKIDEVDIKANISLLDYLPNHFDKNQVIYEYEGIQELTYKIKTGDVLGNVKIFYENEELGNFELILNEEIEYHDILLYIFIGISIGVSILIILKRTVAK